MRNLLPPINIDFRSKAFKMWMLIALISVTIIAVIILILKLNTMTIPVSTSTDVAIGQDNGFGMIIDIFGKLVLVLGLIYLLFSVYRSFQQKNTLREKRYLSIQETLRVTPRQSIYVVQAGSQRFLIGSTDQNICLLAQLDEMQNPCKGEVHSDGELKSSDEPQEFETLFQKTIKHPNHLLHPSSKE